MTTPAERAAIRLAEQMAASTREHRKQWPQGMDEDEREEYFLRHNRRIAATRKRRGRQLEGSLS